MFFYSSTKESTRFNIRNRIVQIFRMQPAWYTPYPLDGSDKAWFEPSMLIVGEKANVDAAIEPLLSTLYEPMARGVVATVFVHETMRDEFIEKVRNAMTVMHRQAARHRIYKKALARIECLGAERVTMMQPDDIGFQYSMVEGSPQIVCDFSQKYFGVGHPSAVVTLHTFRHSREFIELAALENVPFFTATIWCPKMSAAYELAMFANVSAVYINCSDIPLHPLVHAYQAQKPFTLLQGNYHYEVIMANGQLKAIVFPAPFLSPAEPVGVAPKTM